jgi:hypothetical protein
MYILVLEQEIHKKLKSRFGRRRAVAKSSHELRHVRPSSCTGWAATRKISVKFFIGEFYENLSRRNK